MAKLATNDYLTCASTFHSLSAIARQLSPAGGGGGGGLLSVDAPAFSLHCAEAPTGVKFFVTAKPRAEAAAAALLARVYEAYADYALKSPFYETDMPIRIKLFDLALDRALKEVAG